MTPEVIDGEIWGAPGSVQPSEQASEPAQARLPWEGKLRGVFNSPTTFPR